MKRITITVEGRVQGVGYRASVQRKAREENLVGWVKNMPDGTVKIVSEGTDEDFKKLIRIAREGSGLSHVQNIETETSEAEGAFTDFEIAH